MAPNDGGAKKRRREPYTVDTKLVEIYDDLANEKDEIRLKAAGSLVSQFTPDKSPSEDQVQKALQRLFRGICSSRKAARIGFSIALTEVLSQVFAAENPACAVSKVLDIWEAQSNASGSETGQVCLCGFRSVELSLISTGASRPSFWSTVRGGSHHKIFYPVQVCYASCRMVQTSRAGL